MTIQQTDAEAIRNRVHALWDGVAPGWAEHADAVDHRARPVTERLLERAALRPGQRVLELACGPGGVGLEAAVRVGPDGEVVVSDVAAGMVRAAAARAEARGLGNVRAAVLDLEDIDQPDSSFDAVLCREGLMFALDPAGAAAEIARVLRPGGRVAVAVWGPPERNPWLGLLFRHVSEVTGSLLPPPGVPGPFSLADGQRLGGLLAGAGLAGVEVDEVEVPLRAPSFEAWWTRTTTLAGPLAAVVERLPAPARSDLEQRLRDAVAPYRVPDGLELPGLSLVAWGHRP